jgi:biopolymer transport protein ExbD
MKPWLEDMLSENPSVQIAPLIDCVFLLLIFFLVATMYKKQNRDISINLPESSSAVKLPPSDDVIVLGIDEEGGLYWQGTESSVNDLHNRLRQVAVSTPGIRVRLDADEKAPFWRVAEVLDACQFRGLYNVGIRTYDDRYNRR